MSDRDRDLDPDRERALDIGDEMDRGWDEYKERLLKDAERAAGIMDTYDEEGW